MKQNDETYFWKNYRKGSYSIINENCETIKTENIDIEFISHLYNTELDFVYNFAKKYNSFTIEKSSIKAIEYLIESFKLKFTTNQLAFFSAILQQEIIFYTENPFNTSTNQFSDVENEYKDVIQLFTLIKKRLKNQALNDFKGITFEFSNSIKIKSTFILKDILDTYINFYDIDLNNLETKKEERLSDCSNFDLDKLLEVTKLKHLHALNNFIISSTSNLSEERKNKFIVSFTLLSQIPINQNSEEILIPANLREVSKADVNNLRKKLRGEHKIFYKTGN